MNTVDGATTKVVSAVDVSVNTVDGATVVMDSEEVESVVVLRGSPNSELPVELPVEESVTVSLVPAVSSGGTDVSDAGIVLPISVAE